jgi:hypothetical protein
MLKEFESPLAYFEERKGDLREEFFLFLFLI